MRTALVPLVLILAAVAAAAAEPPSATVVVCSSIENNRCEGAAVKFPANVGKLWGFSEAVNVPGQLVHVWFYKDKELGSLTMKAPSDHAERWLCFSNVTVTKNMAGPWRLEARTADGKILATFNFTVE